MIREFGMVEFLYLLGAMKWTLALSLLAFVCGGLLGLVIALLRVAPIAPLPLAGDHLDTGLPVDAAADAPVPDVFRSGVVRIEPGRLRLCHRGADLLRKRLFR
jgi:ABC-type amino acid transport system permease subunit